MRFFYNEYTIPSHHQLIYNIGILHVSCVEKRAPFSHILSGFSVSCTDTKIVQVETRKILERAGGRDGEGRTMKEE